MERYFSQKGISLVEVLVAVGIITLITVAIVTFFVDTFSMNRYISDRLSVSGEARRGLKTMIAEIRTASPSSNGAYALSETATSSFTFYSNIDTDALKERVRYYASGTSLIRGIIKPTGSPLVYNVANEVRTEMVRGLSHGTSTPIFMYYNSSYAGTSTLPTSTPAIADIRLVRILLRVDTSTTDMSTTSAFTTQVSLRNLKDNL